MNAGFQRVDWHNHQVTEEGLTKMGAEFWSDWVDDPAKNVLIEAVKWWWQRENARSVILFSLELDLYGMKRLLAVRHVSVMRYYDLFQKYFHMAPFPVTWLGTTRLRILKREQHLIDTVIDQRFPTILIWQILFAILCRFCNIMYPVKLLSIEKGLKNRQNYCH